jgi:predicted nucleotidyltransferase
MAEAARLNRLEAALRGAAAALTARRWALVGGLAISARCEPRFTRDIDLAVVVSSDADAEALVHALMPAGYRVIATVEHEGQRRLATARLAVPGEQTGGVVVDLLFASSGIEAELVAAATPLEVLPSLVLPVAQVGDLIALKLLSRDDERRPQDAADLRALLPVAGPAEVARARASVQLIQARGFHRDRRLDADLEALLSTRR